MKYKVKKMTRDESIAARISWWLNLYETNEVDLLGARNLLESIRDELLPKEEPRLNMSSPNNISASSLGAGKKSLLTHKPSKHKN
jgi:hypothetical protein